MFCDFLLGLNSELVCCWRRIFRGDWKIGRKYGPLNWCFCSWVQSFLHWIMCFFFSSMFLARIANILCRSLSWPAISAFVIAGWNSQKFFPFLLFDEVNLFKSFVSCYYSCLSAALEFSVSPLSSVFFSFELLQYRYFSLPLLQQNWSAWLSFSMYVACKQQTCCLGFFSWFHLFCTVKSSFQNRIPTSN